MPRMARVLLPECAHHVAQRGVRSEAVFFGPEDRMDRLLRRAHEWSLILGAALMAGFFVSMALVPPGDMWDSRYAGRFLAGTWLIVYVCSIGVLGVAAILGLAHLIRRQPQEDTPSLRSLATYTLAVLALTLQSLPLPDYWKALRYTFWPTEPYLLRWSIFLLVCFAFGFMPMLFHILLRAKRSFGVFDAGLLMVLAVLTVDGLGLCMNSYTRESLFSLSLVKMWRYEPLFITLMVVAPWLLGGWLLNTRRSRRGYLASAALIFGTCAFVYGTVGRLWWTLAR